MSVLLGGFLVVVRGVLIFDRTGELADFFAVDLEVVGIAEMRSDDLFSDSHAFSSSLVPGLSYRRREPISAGSMPRATDFSAAVLTSRHNCCQRSACGAQR